tara:strand:+ start:325 stop:486 length:162 start_codon:yes stop_codon:yes gene_type:complete
MANKKSKKTVVDNKTILNTDAGGLDDSVTQVIDYGEIPENSPPPTSETEETNK